MAISIRGNAGAWAASNATTQAVVLEAHQTGDMLIVRTIRKPFTNPDDTVINDAGWTQVAAGVANGSTANGNGTGSMGFKAFWKIATSASEPNPTVTWGTTSAPGAVCAVTYQLGAGEEWVTPTGNGGGDATARTSQTSTIATHISVTAGDMVDFFRGQCDDSGALTVPTITQTGVTFGTVAEQPAAAGLFGTSNDLATDGGYRLATAGTSSAAAVVTGTSAASEQHGAWMTRLRVQAAPKRSFAQAQANIEQTYSVHGQAQATIISIRSAHAQAQAFIRREIFGHHLTTSSNDVDATSFLTASITPTANRLILAAVWNGQTAANTTPTLTGNGLTWVLVDQAAYDVTGTFGIVHVFRAMGTAPTTGQVTIDFGANTILGCGWSITEFDGIDISGTNGSGAIVQSANAIGLSASADVTLATFSDVKNVTYGALAQQTADVETVGAGFYKFGRSATAVPVTSIASFWNPANDTTVDADWTTATEKWGIIGIEIKAAPISHAGYYNGVAANAVVDPVVTVSGVDWDTGDRVIVVAQGRDEGLDTFPPVVTASGLTFANLIFEESEQNVLWMGIWKSDLAAAPGTNENVVVTIDEGGSGHAGGINVQVIVAKGSNPDVDAFDIVDTGAVDTDTPTMDFVTNETNTRVFVSFQTRNRVFSDDAADNLIVIRENSQADLSGNMSSMSFYYKDVVAASTYNLSGSFTTALDWQVGAFNVYEAGAPATYVHGQAQAWIEQTYFGLGQAQAWIEQTYFGLGQAQADIEQTYSVHGQAQADIEATINVHGQAQASIKQTYPNCYTYASDAFGGSESGTWGNADIGGAWTPASDAGLSISGGFGINTIGGGLGTTHLTAVRVLDVDQHVMVKQSAVANENSFVGARLTGNATGYHARLVMSAPGANSLNLTINTDLTGALASATLASREGNAISDQFYHIRFRVTGANPTRLQAKAWKDGNLEPAEWDLDTTDSTAAYQVNGWIGLNQNSGGSCTFTYDDYNAYFCVGAFGQAQADIESTISSHGQAQALIARLITSDDFNRSVSGTWGTSSDGYFGWGHTNGFDGFMDVNGTEATQFANQSIRHSNYPLLKKGMIQFDFFVGPDIDQTPNINFDPSITEVYNLITHSGPNTIRVDNFFGEQSVLDTDVTTNTWYTFKGTFSDVDGTPTHWKVWKRSDPEPYWQMTSQALDGHTVFIGWPSISIDTDTQTGAIDNFTLWTTEQPFESRRYGAAKASIKTSRFILGQSQARITGINYSLGQAQADIKQTYFVHGQAQAQIKQTYFALGQAQGLIAGSSFAFGQAQAYIKSIGVNVHGQAQAWIEQTYPLDSYPVISASSSGNTAAAFDHTVPLPTNIAAGNLLFVNFASDGTGAASVTTPASGWTILQTGATGGVRGTIFVRVADGNEGPTADITVSTADSVRAAWVVYRIENWYEDLSGVYADQLNVQSNTSAPNPPLATPGWGTKQILFIATLASHDTTAVTVTGWPTNYTLNQIQNVTALGDPEIMAAQAARQATDFSNNPSAFTLSTSADSNVFGTAAVRPKDTIGGGLGQARAWIENTYSAHGQAQARIKNTYFGLGQAQANIEATVSSHGQAQARIKQVYFVHAQAQADIKAVGRGFGQAQAVIDTGIYILVDTFTRVTGSGLGTADSGTTWTGELNNVSDGSFAVLDADNENGPSYQPRVTTRDIRARFDVRIPASGTSVGFFWNAVDGLINDSVIFIVTNGADLGFQFVEGASTLLSDFSLIPNYDTGAFYRVELESFHISASVKRFRYRIYKVGDPIPAFIQNDLATTSLKIGGVALAGSLGAADNYADNINLAPYVPQSYGQAQAEIKQTYFALGQAQAWIEQTYFGLGQAQSWIEQTYFGLGQAQAQIKQTYFGLGQAQANIENTYFAHGQAQALIKQVYFAHAQAQAQIKNTYFGLGQAEAWIEQTYYVHGQAQALIMQTYFVHGQAEAWIEQTYSAHGQANANIEQTYYVHAQAQALIYLPQFSYPDSDVSVTGWVRVVI